MPARVSVIPNGGHAQTNARHGDRHGDRHVVKKAMQPIVILKCGGARWGGTHTGGGSVPTMRRRDNPGPRPGPGNHRRGIRPGLAGEGLGIERQPHDRGSAERSRGSPRQWR
jgi:hypothetical protein